MSAASGHKGPNPANKAPANSVIMGIDPGLRHLGWSVIRISGQRAKLLASGIIKGKDSDSLSTRAMVQAAKLRDLMATHCPHEVYVEQPYQGQASRFKNVNQLYTSFGVCLALGAVPVAPQTYRARLGIPQGGGHCQGPQRKLLTQVVVSAWFPGALEAYPKTKREHVADSIAVALGGAPTSTGDPQSKSP